MAARGCYPTKSSLYRAEVTEAAVRAVFVAVARVAGRGFTSEPLDYGRGDVQDQPRPALGQSDRAVDWATHTTHEIARRVRAADSSPGVLTTLLGHRVYVYGAHEEDRLTGPAGHVIAQRHGALCVGTIDGAVWLTHLKATATEHRYGEAALDDWTCAQACAVTNRKEVFDGPAILTTILAFRFEILTRKVHTQHGN
jgi:putative two-component system protein, hydrogenase maturation factor HypX/HoxX